LEHRGLGTERPQHEREVEVDPGLAHLRPHEPARLAGRQAAAHLGDDPSPVRATQQHREVQRVWIAEHVQQRQRVSLRVGDRQRLGCLPHESGDLLPRQRRVDPPLVLHTAQRAEQARRLLDDVAGGEVAEVGNGVERRLRRGRDHHRDSVMGAEPTQRVQDRRE
jgi:hypothetical protein